MRRLLAAFMLKNYKAYKSNWIISIENVKMPIKFLANKNTIISGPTGSGKTQFILDVIRQKLIHPFPKNIYYMYKVEQEFMRTWTEKEEQPVRFISGLNFEEMDTSEPSMLIIDDLMLSTDKETAELFILGSHHRQVSIFYITQGLFHNCDQYRLMSNNAHYYVIFNNKRNASQIHHLARQVYLGKEQQRIIKAYKRAGQRQWGFIVLSFAPELPEELGVITDWWEICPSVYL